MVIFIKPTKKDLQNEKNFFQNRTLVCRCNTCRKLASRSFCSRCHGGTVAIPLGKFISLLVESCNSTNLVYALKNNEYTTYVSIHDTTTILDEQGKYDYESRFNGLISQTWLTHAGPRGHVYIADRIYDSITHDYTGKAFASEALYAIDTLFTEAKKSANIVKSDIAEFNAYCEETLEKIDQLCKDTVSDITCAIENAQSIGKNMIALVNEKLDAIVAKIKS